MKRPKQHDRILIFHKHKSRLLPRSSFLVVMIEKKGRRKIKKFTERTMTESESVLDVKGE